MRPIMSAFGGKADIGGAADRGQYRQAAGAFAQDLAREPA